MALLRYNPWQEINTLQRQLNQLFDSNTTSHNWHDLPKLNVPRAELTETQEALYLNLELPGIDPNDLDIEVTIDSVSITGERKSEKKDKTISEFYYGKFERVIALPIRVQNTDVTAEYKNGIIHLTLPKAESEKNKVVKVNLA